MSSTHRRRSVLLRSGLALLVTASLAAVGVTGAGSPAAAAGRTDVYMSDQAGDIGTEPNPSTGSYVESPDIRICNTATLCATDQTPTSSSVYVFTQLHNPGPYGSGPSTGTLYLYEHYYGTTEYWPGNWVQFAAKPLTIASGGTTLVTTPWTVPAAFNLHYCILARWVSDTDPMYAEGTDTMQNTIDDNNIVWHNITSPSVFPGWPVVWTGIDIGNLVPTKAPVGLAFTEPKGLFENTGGTLTVDLGTTLFQQWQAAGAQGTGIRPIQGTTQIQVLTPSKAQISGIPVDALAEPQIQIGLSAPTTAALGQYPIEITETGPAALGASPTVTGGAELIANVTKPAQ